MMRRPRTSRAVLWVRVGVPRPAGRKPWRGTVPARRAVAAVACVAMISFVLPYTARFGTRAAEDPRPRTADTPPGAVERPRVLLEPETWRDGPFPLLEHLDIAETLRSGPWTVLLFHHGCPTCEEALRRLASEPSDGVPLAVVELPPYGPRGDDPPGSVRGRLGEDREWVVTTPVVLRLSDGNVREVIPSPKPAEPAAGPRRRLDGTGTTRDLGYVLPGSVHRLELAIDLVLPEGARVLTAVSDCACLRVDSIPAESVPGAKATLCVTFEAPREPMEYSRSLDLVTDSPATPRARIVISARVGLPLRLEPPGPLDLGSLAPGSSREVSLSVRNDGAEAVKILYATADAPGVRARVPGGPLAPGSSVDLPIILSVPVGAPPGPREASLAIRTTHDAQRSLHLRVRHTVAEPPDAEPIVSEGLGLPGSGDPRRPRNRPRRRADRPGELGDAPAGRGRPRARSRPAGLAIRGSRRGRLVRGRRPRLRLRGARDRPKAGRGADPRGHGAPRRPGGRRGGVGPRDGDRGGSRSGLAERWVSRPRRESARARAGCGERSHGNARRRGGFDGVETMQATTMLKNIRTPAARSGQHEPRRSSGRDGRGLECRGDRISRPAGNSLVDFESDAIRLEDHRERGVRGIRRGRELSGRGSRMGTKRRHPPRETEAGDHQGASADQDLSALIEKLHAVGPSDTGPAAGSLGVNVLGRISGKTVDLLLVTVSNGWRVLTDRQIEIMRHAARGKGNQAIAKALGISRDTVRVHMRSILDRLGVRSRHLLPLVASALESALEDRTVPDGPSASKAPTVGSGTSGAAPPLRAGGKRRPIRAKGRHRAVAAEAAGDDE